MGVMLKRKIASWLMLGACRLLLTPGVLLMALFLSVIPLASQTRDHSAAERKLITRVEPDYPETLKRLYIGGVVRVEVVVTPNGVVESAKLLGGNPILGQSAMKAVKRWRYATAGSKEVLAVKVVFDPHR
jgi:TonB family protein